MPLSTREIVTTVTVQTNVWVMCEEVILKWANRKILTLQKL